MPTNFLYSVVAVLSPSMRRRPAQLRAAGTPEPVRGVDADTGVTSGHDDEDDVAAFLSSPEAFAACDEAEKQAMGDNGTAPALAPAPVPPPPADDEVLDEEGAAAAAAAATGSTGGAVSPSSSYGYSETTLST